MKYAMSGHRGLIGTFLTKRLSDEGHAAVFNIDKQDGFNVNDLPDHPPHEADIFIHLAAQCKINEAIKNPSLPHENNTEGIYNVLEFCKRSKIPKIVVMSSSRVLSEEKNPYTASKIYTEELTKAYSDCYGLEYVIIRPSTVYGPKKDVTPRLMHDWVDNALQNKELPVFGDKTKTLDFTYVSDFVDATMLLIDNWDKAKNNDYDISGTRELNVTDVGNLIINEANGGFIKYHAQETAQPQHVSVDTSKLRLLGYKPKVNIKEGVRRMVSYFKNG